MAQPPPFTTPPTNEDSYSASSTLIHFPNPIPLLRRPIPVSPPDDPTLGPYVLAFPTPQSFFNSFRLTQSKLIQQCETGLRIGCSITASNKCKPPWWKTLLGQKIDFRERSECEEREMKACIEGSKEKCGTIAKEKCLGSFGWARVGFRERKLRKKEVGLLISWVSGLGYNLGHNLEFQLLAKDQLGLLSELNLSYDVNYVRGFELLGDDDYQPNSL